MVPVLAKTPATPSWSVVSALPNYLHLWLHPQSILMTIYEPVDCDKATTSTYRLVSSFSLAPSVCGAVQCSTELLLLKTFLCTIVTQTHDHLLVHVEWKDALPTSTSVIKHFRVVCVSCLSVYGGGKSNIKLL